MDHGIYDNYILDKTDRRRRIISPPDNVSPGTLFPRNSRPSRTSGPGKFRPNHVSYLPRWFERLWSTTVCTIFWPFIAIQKAIAKIRKDPFEESQKIISKLRMGIFFALQLLRKKLVVRKGFNLEKSY